jgi:hypothetical protein
MAPGVASTSFIGPSMCQVAGGTPADARRLLSPAIEAGLAGFPRELDQLVVQGPAFVLAWRGLEPDPEVIEHALRVAALCWRGACAPGKSHE